LTKTVIRPIPGHEPKRNKADLAVFDRCNVTKPIRLFEGELKPNVEERPERKPYTLERRKRSPKPFLSPTGEIVMRLRGGRGFTRIVEPWEPEGLLRIRGKLLATLQVQEDGGRVVSWLDYPQGAIAPIPGPYVLRMVVELALNGADVHGHNNPAVGDYVNHVLRANEWARSDVESIGPRIAEDATPITEPEVLPSWLPPGASTWTKKTARQIYGLELEERKRLGRERTWVPGMDMRVDLGRKAKTSEPRDETTGEYGGVTKLTPDGRVSFGKKLPHYSGASIRVRGISDYTQKRGVKFADGRTRRVATQAATFRINKPGPKPKHGLALDDRLRQTKSRCKKRGKPFVVEEHIKVKEPV
jgi:hypothetical protein